jgi:hypothetical protein
MTLDGLRSHVNSNFKQAIKCKFKSRNTIVGKHMFGRGALLDESTAATCSDWSFQAGQALTLLVFTEPLQPQVETVRGKVPQHHRWWPIAKLDLPAGSFFEKELNAKKLGGPSSSSSSRATAGSNIPVRCAEIRHRQYGGTCAECLKHPKGGSCQTCREIGFDCTCSCARAPFVASNLNLN